MKGYKTNESRWETIKLEKKPVFTEISGTEVDALLYTAMFNEVNRLEDCKNKKERQRIRDFILSAYQKLILD